MRGCQGLLSTRGASQSASLRESVALRDLRGRDEHVLGHVGDGVLVEPEDRAGDGHGGDDLAVHGADGGGHGGQPDLVLLYAAGIAAVPYERELPFKGGRV